MPSNATEILLLALFVWFMTQFDDKFTNVEIFYSLLFNKKPKKTNLTQSEH